MSTDTPASEIEARLRQRAGHCEMLARGLPIAATGHRATYLAFGIDFRQAADRIAALKAGLREARGLLMPHVI